MTLPSLFFAAQKVQKTVEVLASATGGDFNTAYESAFASLATITENNSTGGDFNATALVAQVGTDADIVIAPEVSTFLEAFAQRSNELSDQNISVGELDAAGVYLNAYGDSVERILESESPSSEITAITNDLLGTDVNTSTLATDITDVQSFLDNNITYLGLNSADDNITTNLELTQSTGDFIVAWTTSKSAAITAFGVVTRSDTVDETVTMTVNVTKGLAISNKSFNLTVQRNEYAPVAEDVAITIEEDANAIPITFVYSDTNGDALSVTAVSAASHGTAALSEGNVTYTPNLNFNGSDSFTYTVTDSIGLSVTADVNITVNAVNDATVWNTPATLPSVLEDFAPFTVELNATDVDGEVSYRVLGTSDNIGATVSGSTLTVSSVLNASGNETIMLAATQDGVDANLTIAVTVTAVNDAPVAGTFTPLSTVAEDSAYTFTALAVDVDSATLTYSLVNNPVWMSINPSTGVVSGTPTNADVGTASNVQVLVTDGIIASPVSIATFSVTVSNTNDAPVASNSTLGTVKNTATSGTLVANDVDVGDTLTYSLVDTTNSNGNVVVNANGSFTYTPATDYLGDGSFTFKATDANGTDSNLATVSLSVTDAIISVVANADVATVNEDGSVIVDVLANDTLTNETISGGTTAGTIVSAVTTPANGTATIVSGGIEYTPNANFNGTDSFTYTALTLSGNTATATVTVTVSAVNDATVWSPILLQAVNEDFTEFSVELNATDPDGAVTYSLGSTNGIVNASVSGSTLTISPIANANGHEIITVIATQAGATVAYSTTLTVNAVNDAPIANPDNFSALLNTTNADGWDILANDIDVEGPLSIASCETTTAESGSVTYNTAEVTSYTPAEEFVGVDTFSCTITDGDLNATALVTVSVSGNHAPEASGANITMTVGESITGKVIATDADDDNLTFSVTGGDLANLQGSSLNSDGTYNITASGIGSGYIVVTVTDDGVPAMSTTANYNVNVIEAQTENSAYNFSDGGEISETEWNTNPTLAIPADTKLYSIWSDNNDGNISANVDYLEFMSDGSFIVSEDNSSDYAHDGVVVGSNVTDGNSDGMIAVSQGATYNPTLKVAELKLLEVYEGNESVALFPDITMPNSAVVYKTAVKMVEASYYLDRPADDCTQNNECLTYPSLNVMIDNNAHGLVGYNQENYNRILVFGSDQNLSDTNGTVMEVDKTDIYNGGEPFVINANAGTWSVGTYTDENDQSIDMVVVTLADGISGFDNKHIILVAPGAIVNGITTESVWKGNYDPAGSIMVDYRFNDVASAVLQNVINPVTAEEYMALTGIAYDTTQDAFNAVMGIYDPRDLNYTVNNTVYSLEINQADGFLLAEMAYENSFVTRTEYVNGVAATPMVLSHDAANGINPFTIDGTYEIKIAGVISGAEYGALTGFAMPQSAYVYQVYSHEVDTSVAYFEHFANTIAKEVIQANFRNQQ
jgi:VCBS repeat-containing protein